jgi:transcriptional regulator with XRE-family HTH domain
VKNVGTRIKHLREGRNYTQDFVANRLGISQNAYSKIETGQTKLTTQRADEISKVLEVPVESLLSNDSQIFNVHNSTIDKFYIENLQEENKELIASLIQQNEFLRKEIEFLRSIIEKQE